MSRSMKDIIVKLKPKQGIICKGTKLYLWDPSVATYMLETFFSIRDEISKLVNNESVDTLLKIADDVVKVSNVSEEVKTLSEYVEDIRQLATVSESMDILAENIESILTDAENIESIKITAENINAIIGAKDNADRAEENAIKAEEAINKVEEKAEEAINTFIPQIEEKGNEEIEKIIAEGDSQYNRIQTEGDTQYNRIKSQGNIEVEKIKEEGLDNKLDIDVSNINQNGKDNIMELNIPSYTNSKIISSGYVCEYDCFAVIRGIIKNFQVIYLQINSVVVDSVKCDQSGTSEFCLQGYASKGDVITWNTGNVSSVTSKIHQLRGVL